MTDEWPAFESWVGNDEQLLLDPSAVKDIEPGVLSDQLRELALRLDDVNTYGIVVYMGYGERNEMHESGPAFFPWTVVRRIRPIKLPS